MHSSTLLTSILAVGAVAWPQKQLEKRQQVTVVEMVTVTATVFRNPYETPAWTPPQLQDTKNPYQRPTNAPPAWTPPRFSTVQRVTSSTRPVASPAWTPPRFSTAQRVTSSTRLVVPVSSATSATSVNAPQSAAPSATRSSTRVVVGSPSSVPAVIVPSSPVSSIVGQVLSNTQVASSPAPAASSTAPTAPFNPENGHISGASQATLQSGPEYQRAILYHHNAARANHNAGPLVWNDTVAQTAALAANTCRFEHYIPTGIRQGQNLFTTSGTAFNVTAGITESWYKSELPPMIPYFGQATLSNDVFHEVGHLTQLLWKGTTSVGCVSIDCGNRMVVGSTTGSTLNKYTVCNYFPAGNVGGQYAINVEGPISTSAAALGSWSD